LLGDPSCDLRDLFFDRVGIDGSHKEGGAIDKR
jgi:hypothetical protein